ncbi:MAG: VWA domain-containing protein [Acidobacteriota bacterium]
MSYGTPYTYRPKPRPSTRSPRSRATWLAAALVCVLTQLAGLPPLAAQQTPPTGAEMPLNEEARSQLLAALSPQYLKWLQSVRGLMTHGELDYFLRLEEDFRRDVFMRAFWEPRDPDPETSVNELKARWERFKDNPDGVPYGDPRFLLLLYNGPPGAWSLPDGRPVARCFSRAKELEIWFYGESERVQREFPVVLLRRAVGAEYEVYLPGGPLRAVQRSGGLPSNNIQELCADDLLRYTFNEISRIVDYDQLVRDALSPLLPSPEWLANLASSATDLPRGAETFEVDVDLAFPARKQSRTAVRLMLGIDLEQAPGRRFDGELFHNFQLIGEVIREGKLFESFRYGFEGPTPDGTAKIPLGFTRYLRPGPVSLRVLVEDLYTGRFAQVVRELEIPAPEGLEPVAVSLVEEQADGPILRLVPPAGTVHVGKMRFRTRTYGDFEKVSFYLNGKRVLSKRRPPYSVELDLGESPVPHRIRVVGLVGDQEVATDQIWLNQGAQRFRVQLLEPRDGGIYPGGLTARIQVDTPDGAPPEQVALFLDGERVASFDAPPFEHTLRLADQTATVVRAVATLDDGTEAEDAVIVNGAAFAEAIEVRLVELPVRVVDAQGRPMLGLQAEQFRIFDNGTPRRIERFQAAGDGAVAAALLIDRSISMDPHMDAVAAAAGAFAQAALTSPDDRVAVLSFASDLVIDIGLTAKPAELERALAGLDAGGGTALYDSLAQAYNTFDGTAGPLALVLFTDGQDEASRLTFEQAVDASRRSAATLFAIGYGTAFAEKQDRRVLEQLARETGGEAFFLTELEALGGAFETILETLRSRYLLTFQPTVSGEPAGSNAPVRTLRVTVDADGARVQARGGYVP